MDNGFSSVPGFRSLSQAGIRLQEGLPIVSASLAATASQAEDQHRIPPGNGAFPAAKSRWAEAVSIEPREPGTRRPVPREHPPEAAEAGGALPNGIYVGTLPPLRFACPCCATVLTIPSPESYHGQPGPCPHCSAIVLPPRVVSPFVKADEEAVDDGKRRHYSGYLL